MPTLLLWQGYRFLFYSKEDGEPPHVHVRRDRSQAKFWLDEVSLARNAGFRAHELVEIERKIKEYRDSFLDTWHEYFSE